MMLPNVADSLAGRMETLSLLPLSQSEITSRPITHLNWIAAIFNNKILQNDTPALGDDLIERVLKGGFPEALTRSSTKRRTAWARQYINALIQRDVCVGWEVSVKAIEQSPANDSKPLAMLKLLPKPVVQNKQIYCGSAKRPLIGAFFMRLGF